MKKKIVVSDLFQSYHKVTVHTEGELLFFGKSFIRYLIRTWRYSANSQTGSIKSLQDRINALEGKDAISIQELAKGFEDPTFPSIQVPKDGLSKDPEPTDSASLIRKAEATTFNVCGWCKYAGDGKCRHSFHITTTCSFTTDKSKRLSGVEGEHRFNTVCFLKKADTQTFQVLLDELRRKLEEANRSKKEMDEKVRYLLTLEKKAEEKVSLPNHRSHKMFNVGDQVIVYIGGWKADAENKKLVDKTFVSGVVIDGYRHHDGYVSVCFDEKVHTGEYLEGRGIGTSTSRPEVMLRSEFEYLLANPDFANLYASGHERIEGFKKSGFLTHLSEFKKAD